MVNFHSFGMHSCLFVYYLPVPHFKSPPLSLSLSLSAETYPYNVKNNVFSSIFQSFPLSRISPSTPTILSLTYLNCEPKLSYLRNRHVPVQRTQYVYNTPKYFGNTTWRQNVSNYPLFNNGTVTQTEQI